jgi:DNA-binding FrmR family transcriptional regulator
MKASPKPLYHTPLRYMQAKTEKKTRELSTEQQKLVSRIKRIRGQIVAIERTMSTEEDCGDVLMQLAAVRGGINSLMAEILEDHIRLHILTPDQSPLAAEEMSEHLIDLVRAYLK